MKGKLYILIAFALIAGSCSSRPGSSGILEEKKMVELLVDIHLTDAVLYTNNGMADVKRDKSLYYYPSVLEKHGITKAQMDSSVAWYTRHPPSLTRVYEKVIKDLEKRQAAEPKIEKTDE
jgi:hypothetical protein